MSPTDFETTTVNKLHGFLSSSVHRRLLRYLEEADQQSHHLRTIATEIAETDPAEDDTIHRLECKLHHSSLPKLDTLGIIDYDPTNLCVRYWGTTFLADPVANIMRYELQSGAETATAR